MYLVYLCSLGRHNMPHMCRCTMNICWMRNTGNVCRFVYHRKAPYFFNTYENFNSRQVFSISICCSAGFLNLWYGGFPLHFRMFNCFPGLYTLDVNNNWDNQICLQILLNSLEGKSGGKISESLLYPILTPKYFQCRDSEILTIAQAITFVVITHGL